MRQNASDEQLTYEYGYYALLKKQLTENPDYITDIKRFVDAC